MLRSAQASAPGSFMLLGEYAVLHHQPALVCALDKRISVSLTARQDDIVEIKSALGEHQTSLKHLKVVKPFEFVLQALRTCKTKLTKGINIDIVAHFSDQIGFGSSAAVTVATLAALHQYLESQLTPLELLRMGRRVIRAVQGRGSGADVAASVYGGLIQYRAHPLEVIPLSGDYPITAWYSGFKTKTADAIQEMQQRFQHAPKLYQHLYLAVGQCVQKGVEAVQQQNWNQLGKVMNVQQGLLDALGVNLPVLQTMVERMRDQQAILGAKISGSGLGDCVVGLGHAEMTNTLLMQYPHVAAIPVAMTSLGVCYE